MIQDRLNMEFSVTSGKFGECMMHTLCNRSTGESVEIINGFGVNTRSVRLLLNGRLCELLFNDATPEELTGSGIFRGAKLTPFVNRVKNCVYRFEKKEYKLEMNWPREGHAIHGLLYNKEWAVKDIHAGDDYASASFGFEIDRDQFKGYPFRLSVSVEFRLTKSGLEIATTAKNTGNKNAPFGDGWHPYFRFDKGSVNDWQLRIDSDRIVETENLIPTGRFSNVEETSYDFRGLRTTGDLFFDTCFKLNFNGKKIVKTVLHNPLSSETIAVWQDSNYPYLQVYTPKSRVCIAIEPVTASSDALNQHRFGLIVLRPGETFRGRYGVSTAE